MNDETTQPSELFLEVITEQLSALLVFLARPSVQRQLLAIALILFLVWFLPELIRRWLNQRYGAREENIVRWRRRARQVYGLFSPVVGLILVQVAIWLFGRLDYPFGLLENSRSLFWIWLVYRAILLVLYSRFGNSVRPYHRWIFLPAFILLVLLEILNSFIGLTLLKDIHLLSVGDRLITLGNIFSSLVLLYVFGVLAWVTEQFLNRNLPARLNVEPGVIQSVSTLSRYAIFAFGLLVSLYALGLDLTSLAIVAGGLSVGIGIGLQDVIGNFVSGLLLLFEQSLRPGDVIELNGEVNEVKRVSIRSTTVLNRDNVEVIIPNATFTNQQFTTLTKTDRLVRIRMPIGVSYDSDPTEVRRIAQDVAKNHGLILEDPAPQLLFEGYGNSSLDFELAVWTNRPEQRQFIRSDLYYMIWTAFAKNNIEIPFPQRDLNLKRGWEKLLAEPAKE